MPCIGINFEVIVFAQSLKSSVDLDGTIFETHYNLGIAYTQAEKYPEAVETFENAIKLRPDFADAYYSLAVAQENFAKGVVDGTLKKADKDDKDDADEAQEAPKTVDADGVPAKKVLTKEEKAQAAELFEASIKSYETYLEKGQDIKDKAEVESKIEYLQKQVEKYSEAKPGSAE